MWPYNNNIEPKKDSIYKFNELGRWIPLVANYKRVSFENLEHHINDFLPAS